MANYTPNTLTGAIAPQNAENTKIETAIASHLDRDPEDGQANQMNANLDMNSNRVINLSAPTNANDAARLVDTQGTSVLPAQTGNNGRFLRTDGTVATWQEVSSGTDDITNESTVTGTSLSDALEALQQQVDNMAQPYVPTFFSGAREIASGSSGTILTLTAPANQVVRLVWLIGATNAEEAGVTINAGTTQVIDSLQLSGADGSSDLNSFFIAQAALGMVNNSIARSSGMQWIESDSTITVIKDSGNTGNTIRYAFEYGTKQ